MEEEQLWAVLRDSLMFNAIYFSLKVPIMIMSTFILQNLGMFLYSQCWGTRKQNGSGCRAPSAQHLFVFHTGEITDVFIPAF